MNDDILIPHPPPLILRADGHVSRNPAISPMSNVAQSADRPHLSLIAPVYNEVENLEPLFARVADVLADIDFELVLVDDGSRDGSRELIADLHARDPRVRGISFARNCGQTAAIAAGIHQAVGRLVATMDADMQNDPGDLPAMIALLEKEGVDAVVGWRTKRNDTVVRRLSSRIANNVRNRMLNDSIRDTGCSLKVFKRDAIQSIPLYEGMHRFLPTLLKQRGYTVLEHGVSHHPRTRGVSKYGIGNRAWRAFKDMLAVRWMGGRMLRLPIASVDAPDRGPASSAASSTASGAAAPKPEATQR